MVFLIFARFNFAMADKIKIRQLRKIKNCDFILKIIESNLVNILPYYMVSWTLREGFQLMTFGLLEDKE